MADLLVRLVVLFGVIFGIATGGSQREAEEDHAASVWCQNASLLTGRP